MLFDAWFEQNVSFCADKVGDDIEEFQDCIDSFCHDCPTSRRLRYWKYNWNPPPLNVPNSPPQPPLQPNDIVKHRILTHVFMGTTLFLLFIVFSFVSGICYYKIKKQRIEQERSEQNRISIVTVVLNPDNTSFIGRN